MLGVYFCLWRKITLRMLLLNMAITSAVLGFVMSHVKARWRIATLVNEGRRLGVGISWSLEDDYRKSHPRSRDFPFGSGIPIQSEYWKCDFTQTGGVSCNLTSTELARFSQSLQELPLVSLMVEFQGAVADEDFLTLTRLKQLKRLDLFGSVRHKEDIERFVNVVSGLPLAELLFSFYCTELDSSVMGAYVTNPIDDSFFAPLFVHPTLKAIRFHKPGYPNVQGNMFPTDRDNHILEHVTIENAVVVDKSRFSRLKHLKSLKDFRMSQPQQLTAEDYDVFSQLSSLRYLGVAADKMTPSQIEAFAKKTGWTPLTYPPQKWVYAFAASPDAVEGTGPYNDVKGQSGN